MSTIMYRPSWTFIITSIFLSHIAYSVYSISLLFATQSCVKGEPCLKSYLHSKPKLQLHFFVSSMYRPLPHEAEHILTVREFNYTSQQSFPINLNLPKKHENETVFLQIIIVPDSRNRDFSYKRLREDPLMVCTRIKMTQYAVPTAGAFNLLGEEKKYSKEYKPSTRKNKPRPTSHLRSQITFTMVTDIQELPRNNIPRILIENLRVTRKEFLPIVYYDFLHTHHNDLVRLPNKTETMNVTIRYTPVSIGYLKLMLHVKSSMKEMKDLGFSDTDIDFAKGIFVDTNIYLLVGAIFIASMHLIFDFLAFKNDITFWKSKSSFEGLSVSTIVWRAFSQAIIFLYLLDEGSSLFIVIPAGIGTLIEFWKTKKVLRLEIVRSYGIFPQIQIKKNLKSQDEEVKTRECDVKFLRRLMLFLFPLIIAGAIYSLIYVPHKSWYSWCINSLVNGVYAFGFLFMLPQLFVNYQLKSVAHLPWRAFMYKACNTFIDDVFAFIITMPVAHRVACFRDDIIFLIYLYQRWLYPVDINRRDTVTVQEEIGTSVTEHKLSNKKQD